MANRHQNTSWDNVAAWYDQHVTESSDFHKNLIIPGALKLLNIKPGETILDLGCGQGVLAGKIADMGTKVTGIDSSKKLIDIAVKRHPKVKFLVDDASRLSGLADNSFDKVLSILALQNMENLDKVFAQTSRVIKNGGRFVFVINHPCFRIPRQSGWGFDEERKLQYRRVDLYMTPIKIPIQMHPGSDPNVVTWTFHRPISEYINCITKNGFVVNSLEEWVSDRVSKPGKFARSENKARNEIPMFLALLCEKL